MGKLFRPSLAVLPLPEDRPPFPKRMLEVREVQTPFERQGYDRVLFDSFKGQKGKYSRDFESLDERFVEHRRFIAQVSFRAVGTGMLAKLPESGQHAILRLCVDRRFRNPSLGVARAIASRIEGEARKQGIPELISYCSEKLVRVYQKVAGYEPVEKKDDVPGIEPYWVIRKKLD